jgi:hypothetical protein
MKAPDYVEPTVGWRSSSVVEESVGVRLASLGGMPVWAPRRELVAACDWGNHVAPKAQCSCGIYAARAIALPADYMTGFWWGGACDRVVGRVSLWGSVVECEEGWRASHAYPERIFVPAGDSNGRLLPDAGDLAIALSIYGVPVHLVDNDLSGQRLRLHAGSPTEPVDYVTLLPLVSWTREAASRNPWGAWVPPEAA